MSEINPSPSLSPASQSSTADRLVKNALQAKYVKELWIFLASIIALLVWFRVARVFLSLVYPAKPSDIHRLTEKGDPEHLSISRTGKVSFRRLPSAFAAGFRIVAFRWTIPIGPQSVASVSELAFILGYILAIFIWLLIDTRDLQKMFWEDRAAHFASCQLPLVIALSGKNNIISFLTGIGHERLNVLHRAAARTCLILLWMHAISRTASGLPKTFDFTHGWVICGAAALTAFSLAALLSIRPIRQLAFEFFLVSHIILIATFLICGYFHARETGFGVYIWPALMLWALDRALRTACLLRNNRVWSRAKPEHSTATVDLLSEDTIRLTLRRQFTWRPGQHAYIILPTVSNLPTEAHPFTIASIPKPAGGGDNELVFLIRGRTGFTKRLKDHATRNSGSTVLALVDGPYGCPPDLQSFSTCVLIAGGSGVSYTLALLLDLIHNHRGPKSLVRRVVFVWSVRDGGHLTWISKMLTDALASSPPSLTIEPRVYITGASYPIPEVPVVNYEKSTSPSTPSVSSDKEKMEPELPLYSALKLKHGRPSIRKLLQEEITTSLGPVSVDVAGPSALTQSVRKALCSDLASPSAVLRGLPSVTLHVETFGMVKG